jgi:hypothetical protein
LKVMFSTHTRGKGHGAASRAWLSIMCNRSGTGRSRGASQPGRKPEGRNGEMTTEQALARAVEMLGEQARVVEAPDGTPARFIVGRFEEFEGGEMVLGIDVWGLGDSWEDALRETELKVFNLFRELGRAPAGVVAVPR